MIDATAREISKIIRQAPTAKDAFDELCRKFPDYEDSFRIERIDGAWKLLH